MTMVIELIANLPINKVYGAQKGDLYTAEWLDHKRNKTVKFISPATGTECVAFQGEYKILIGEKEYETRPKSIQRCYSYG